MFYSINAYIDRLIRYAKRKTTSAFEAEIYSHQAFGAVEYFIMVHPEVDSLIIAQWDEIWKPKFEAIIHDKYM